MSKRSFISPVGPTVHTDPWQERSFSKMPFKQVNLKTPAFRFHKDGKIYMLKTEHFENDHATIITWFPCSSFQNDRWLLGLILRFQRETSVFRFLQRSNSLLINESMPKIVLKSQFEEIFKVTLCSNTFFFMAYLTQLASSWPRDSSETFLHGKLVGIAPKVTAPLANKMMTEISPSIAKYCLLFCCFKFQTIYRQ